MLFLLGAQSSWGANLNLKKVAQIYIQESHLLKSLKSEIEAAEAEEEEASRQLWPSISWSNSVVDQQVPASMYGGFNISPKKIYSSGLSFQQPLYLGGKIWKAWSLRQQAIVSANLKYQNQKQQLLTAVTLKAVQLYVSKKVNEVLFESQKLQKQFWDIVRLRAQRGASKDYEVAQAEGDYYSYVAKIHQQESLIQSYKSQLATDLGFEGMGQWDIDLDIPTANEKLALEKKERPDVLLAKQQIHLAELNKSLAMGDHYPTIQLQGTWGYQAKDQGELFDQDSKSHNIGLSINIPLFSGLTSLSVRRANESRITGAKLQYKYLQDQAAMELQNSQQKLQLASQVLQANKKWSEQAFSALKKGLASYKLGVISTFQMVQLQKGYEGAALSYWSSLASYYSEKLNWLNMNGQELAEQL
ncbi:MAG: TolC family protein [Bdellovibrionaceae bacterium]|nr:TolC family protein [Pseudobdellovibrionaceae bacterium]